MPFTLTHTLAVLPIAHRQTALPVTALLIGAMVPDWSLFVPFGPHYRVTHTPAGLLTACLPLGFVLFLVFNGLYRRALIELAPARLQCRLTKFRSWQTHFGAAELLFAAAAVLIGASTHLVWDAFSHHGRWGVQMLPVLSATMFTIGSSEVQLYKLIQHGSSLIGLPLLAYLAWRWLQRQPIEATEPPLLSHQAQLALLTLLIGLPFVIACVKTIYFYTGTFTLHWLNRALVHAVTEFGLWMLVLFTVYSVALRCKKTARHRIDLLPGLPN